MYFVERSSGGWIICDKFIVKKFGRVFLEGKGFRFSYRFYFRVVLILEFVYVRFCFFI